MTERENTVEFLPGHDREFEILWNGKPIECRITGQSGGYRIICSVPEGILKLDSTPYYLNKNREAEHPFFSQTKREVKMWYDEIEPRYHDAQYFVPILDWGVYDLEDQSYIWLLQERVNLGEEVVDEISQSILLEMKSVYNLQDFFPFVGDSPGANGNFTIIDGIPQIYDWGA